MASRGSPSPSPSSPSRRRRGFARKCERCCWTSVTHMPLAFVYGLTTWAVYVEGTLSLLWLKTSWRGTSDPKRSPAKPMLIIEILRLPFPHTWTDPLHPSQLVLQHCRLYRPWLSFIVTLLTNPQAQEWIYAPILAPPNLRTLHHLFRTYRPLLFHSQIYWRSSLLQKMPDPQTRPRTPLLYLPTMCVENGPSLSLAGDLCRVEELQAVFTVSDIYDVVFLGVFRRLFVDALDGDSQ